MNDPEIFIQTRPTTCGIATLMMALKMLGERITLTKGTEGDLYRYLKPKTHSVVPVVKLAWYARAKAGKNVAMYIEKGPVDFWEYLRTHDEDMFEAQEQSYKIAHQSGVDIRYGAVSEQLISDLVKDGNVIIVGTDLGGGIKHALLVYEATPTSFLYVDPLSGKREAKKDEFMKLLKMDFGSWAIAIH